MTEATRDHPAFATRPLRVTLFEDRAEVVRQARIALEAGKAWVAFRGVSPFVDDRSLRAKPAREGVRLLGARVVRRVAEVPAEEPEVVAEREEALRAAEAAVAAARAGLSRATGRQERAAELLADWRTGLARIPEGLGEDASREAWRAAHGALVAEAGEAFTAEGATREVLRRAEEEAGHARARLSAARARHPRTEARVELLLEANEASELEVELTYRVPCALWRPEHLARLCEKEGQAPRLELVTFAVAWQRTGEDWESIPMHFSTARPGRAASAPTLQDDRLRSREKGSSERQKVVVELREQAVAMAGLEGGQRAVEAMPGVDDGGEPLSLESSEPVSLPSDGEPFRVEVGRRSLEAEVERVVYPELGTIAHIRATATLAGELPLLAGPLRLARGSGFVGRAKVDFVAPGEPFELGFGTDDAVRVRRDAREKRERTPVIGTQHLEKRVTIYLSNQSGDPRRVLVIERVPVSEIEDVEVSLLDAQGWTHVQKDGFLRQSVELAPRDTSELTCGYALKAGSKVELPF